jgi:predicted DNA-binding transcriptional regulator AlpA
MAPKVDTEDLVGAAEVAEILGLSSANSVSTYRSRYADFPDPVVVLEKSRISLWLRQDVETWNAARSRRRGRPAKR